jgi:hypothetical protein
MFPAEIKDDIEKLAGFFWGIIGCLAILCELSIKGITWENVFDALKDIAGLATIIVAVIVSIRASRRNITLDMLAEQALRKLQLKNNRILSGPEFNSSTFNPDPEKKTTRMRYLFLLNLKKNKTLKMNKIAFIPVDFLADGVLDIRVSKATLANLGFESPSTDLIKKCQVDVQKEVKQVLDRLVPVQFTPIHLAENGSAGVDVDPDDSEDEGKENKTPSSKRFENSACVIALNKDMKHRLFSKVVYECAEKALEKLNSFKG